MSDLEIADVLDRAAAHIEKVGWLQGDLYDDYTVPRKQLTECRVCAMGALNVALHGTPIFPLDLQPHEMTSHEIADIVRRRIDDVELADWNDAPQRSQDEVTALLRKTAAELREEAAR
jgi:hypothetical protein